MPTTEAIDRLYLELSQFTKAKTAREIALEALIKRSWEWIDRTIAQESLSTLRVGAGDRLKTDLLAALKA